MTADQIIANNLYKSFRQTHAVAGVNLRIPSGEIFGLVGPDGAGKTTLLRLLCGALHPDQGEVFLDGFPMAGQSEQARERIGYLSQRFALYEELTVLENIRFFAEVRGLSANDWEPRSREILEFVGLKDFVERRAGQLSGGMKQKLGLAVALVNRPKILLLDEPTTGVDPVTRQDFWQLIIRLVTLEKVAVVVSTPYMDEASRCMRLGFMAQGKILLEGTPKKLRERLNNQIIELSGHPLPLFRQKALSNADVENAQMFGGRIHIRTKPGRSNSVIEHLNKAALEENLNLTSLKLIPPQLEDVFISLLEKDQKKDE